MSELENLQQQHYKLYVNAIKEIVINNTDSLFDVDIASLIQVPPLDSMDQIKIKFLTLAKKEKIVLSQEKLSNMIKTFRSKATSELKEMKKIRCNFLFQIIDDSNDEIFRITKKQLATINLTLKKMFKDCIDKCISKYILSKLDTIFTSDIDPIKVDSMKKEITKFLGISGIYQKQLFESIDFKIIVKDTTLINGIKEQSDRYLFTINNSRIFNETI